MLWQWNFQHLVQFIWYIIMMQVTEHIYSVPACMTFRVTVCSLPYLITFHGGPSINLMDEVDYGVHVVQQGLAIIVTVH